MNIEFDYGGVPIGKRWFILTIIHLFNLFILKFDYRGSNYLLSIGKIKSCPSE